MGDAVVYEAQEVILAEARALRMLADSLDGDFLAAVSVLETSAEFGRLIVTGIGKSAIVGQKIASTFRSLGYPAHFIHASEALHGDLGGLTDVDVLLALSASGTTAEVQNVLQYADRLGAATILMTRQGMVLDLVLDLDTAVDFLLLIPNLPEADDTGLVPTTSPICMMALGDALALAVAKKIGFTKDKFRLLHPGGSIGEKLREEGAG